MYSQSLKTELTKLALVYKKNNFYNSKEAVIFNKIEDNFYTYSWGNIGDNSNWRDRTKKVHSHFKGNIPQILEMQSSNSSDALAMNIFCHPKISKWKGILNLLEVHSIENIDFGFKARVIKNIEEKEIEDTTEVDIHINDELIVECKLTENDFTSKDKSKVFQYKNFKEVFYTDKLPQTENKFKNYQLIRNILASVQHKNKFILMCDMRRPDLVNSFIDTVKCVKDIEHRNNCKIIYWQDIAQVVEKGLRDFLNIKYGI